MKPDFSPDPARGGRQAVRARHILHLSGEGPARGPEALNAPLACLEDGVVIARDGLITDIRRARDYTPGAGEAFEDLGDAVLAPGLVNCHSHLELSHMAGKTLRGNGFHAWLRSLIACDKGADAAAALPALDAAASSMAAAGVVLAGDISSRMPQRVLASARGAGLELRLFLEVIGSDPAGASRLAAMAGGGPAFSLAGHALYTTPGATLAGAKAWCEARGRPFSLHLAEHEDEEECLLTGRGRFHDFLRGAILPEDWRAPILRPVDYAASLGLLSPGVLAVHCVRCTAADVETLARSGAAVCLCPRSNAFIGVGEAPARAFAEKGALLVLGTDSLASITDLSLWSEAEYFLKKNTLPANALLRMATVNGAAVLGHSRRQGRLEKGLRFCYTVFPSEMITLFRCKTHGL
ncbi:MAG: amidohydrolase family protein [Deltaproteobacteria bacterium]|jgi:cytosine/adenosine deaminase-related metal-dependent hydrolase|nr:amidohydrolase family protein [Deltaproteobacteria bacterium]